MKHQVENTIKALLMMATLLVSVEGFAAKPCPNELLRNDNLMDLRAIHPAQDKFYDEMDETGENAKYDLRREIDRQNLKPNDPMYALNAIGKVTASNVQEGQPGFTESAKAEENRSWGTGFMISPCHMITNHHVVCEKEVVEGKKVCKRNNAVNTNVNFSFGENDTGTDFKNRTTGNILESDANVDYAIVKIDSLKNKSENTPYVVPNFWDVSNIDEVISLGAGYPLQSSAQDSHKIFGMKSKLQSSGMHITGKITFTPGNSGSPTLSIKNNKLWASGLVVGGGYDSLGKAKINSKSKIISMPSVGSNLKQKNPALLKEIVDAIKNGRCE